MPRLYLGLGSNLEPARHLRQALDGLTRFLGPLEVSPAYHSLPFGGLDQAPYANLVAAADCLQPPRELLQALLQLEAQMGRVRTGQRWASRSIDIDILLYGDWVIAEPGLTIPHYDLGQRDFFLQPLLDLVPDLCHPQSGVRLAALLAALPPETKTNLQPFDLAG